MGSIEEEIFNKHKKPNIYCRYIDDIFIQTEDENEAEQLRLHLQEASSLNFTIENSINNSMPFLDVLVKREWLLPDQSLRQTYQPRTLP